jgi:Leucine-rich repeat (LRR) protein
MTEKEQKRAELLHRREQFIRLVDSFTEDNINLALLLMKGNQDLKLTFKRVFHPLLESIEGALGAGYSLLHKIRQKLETDGYYYRTRYYVGDFWLRFYSYYAQQGRVDNVWHWIIRWHRANSFSIIKTSELLQDIFFRSELKDLSITRITLNSPPAPNLNIAVATRHLAELKELEIENSADWLAYLAPHFAAMPKLETLTLKNCNLSELPESVASLPNLTAIIIDNNNFSQLPEVLINCKALVEISIRYNQLTALPDWLWKLKKMKRLMISYNPMPVLSEYIFTMPNLWWLEIAGNGIKTLPIQKKNTKIGWLDIKNNPIGELPESLVYLRKLKVLRAENCQIRHFPDWFGEFEHLESLNLSANLFTAVPASLKKLTKLNTLCISNIPITQMPNLSDTHINFFSISSKLMPADLAALLPTYLPKSCYING